MPTKNDWVTFLKSHKGVGLTMQQLSTKYRQEHGVKDIKSPCNKNYKTKAACKADKSCSWVKNTTVHRGKKTYPRKEFCRGVTFKWEKHCLACGDLKYLNDWDAKKCDRCLGLSAQQHERLGLETGAFQTYKAQSLRLR